MQGDCINIISGSQVDSAQEVYPNKCNINVCVGRGMKGRRIFSLMDYFVSYMKVLRLNSLIIGHLQSLPSLGFVLSLL